MLDVEVLILELLAVDGFATCTVAFSEVSALNHKLWDDAVEARALIAEAILTSGQLVEVPGCLGDLVAVEAYDDATEVPAALLDVEVDFLGNGSVGHGD